MGPRRAKGRPGLTETHGPQPETIIGYRVSLALNTTAVAGGSNGTFDPERVVDRGGSIPRDELVVVHSQQVNAAGYFEKTDTGQKVYGVHFTSLVNTVNYLVSVTAKNGGDAGVSTSPPALESLATATPEAGLETKCQTRPADAGLSRAEVLGLSLGLTFSLLIVGVTVVVAYVYVRRSGAAGVLRRLRGPPDPANPETSFAMTDIQDSTRLWESLPADVMSRALTMHNDCLRQALRECYGYLSFTEGDAFFVAFHTVADAVHWALLVQERLLALPWPPELLAHPAAAEVYGGDGVQGGEAGASPKAGSGLLYRGLRVRIGIHAGGAETAESGKGAAKLVYTGRAPSLTRTVCDAGEGGATLVTGSSFARLAEEFGDALQPFHCGEYALPSPDAAGPGARVEEQIVLVEPKRLAARVAGFPHALKAPLTQLSPHALDAPRGDVTLCFTYFPAAEALAAWDPGAASEALDLANAVARGHLAAHGGYECESMPGFFYASFSSSVAALRWAIAVQEGLMLDAPWPAAVLEHPGCEELRLPVMAPDDEALAQGSVRRVALHETVFRGPRAKMGLYAGSHPGQIHAATGRMTYSGAIANRTARIASGAAPGQILASEWVVRELLGLQQARTAWHGPGKRPKSGRRGPVGAEAGAEGVKVVEIGQATLKGVAEPVKVYGVASERLWKRPLARPDGFLSQQPSLARNLKSLLGRSKTLAPQRGDSILVDVLGDSDDAGSLSESWAEELEGAEAEAEEAGAGAREPLGG